MKYYHISQRDDKILLIEYDNPLNDLKTTSFNEREEALRWFNMLLQEYHKDNKGIDVILVN